MEGGGCWEWVALESERRSLDQSKSKRAFVGRNLVLLEVLTMSVSDSSNRAGRAVHQCGCRTRSAMGDAVVGLCWWGLKLWRPSGALVRNDFGWLCLLLR